MKAAITIFCPMLFVACSVALIADEIAQKNSPATVASSEAELRGKFVLSLGYDHALVLTLNENRGTLTVVRSNGASKIAFDFTSSDGVMHLKFNRVEEECPLLQDLVIAKIDGELILIPQPIIHAFCVAFKKAPTYAVRLDCFRVESFTRWLDGKLVLPKEFQQYQSMPKIEVLVKEVTSLQAESGGANKSHTFELKFDQGSKHHIFKGMLLELDNENIAEVKQVNELESIARYHSPLSNNNLLIGKTFSTPENPMAALYGLLPAAFK